MKGAEAAFSTIRNFLEADRRLGCVPHIHVLFEVALTRGQVFTFDMPEGPFLDFVDETTAFARQLYDEGIFRLPAPCSIFQHGDYIVVAVESMPDLVRGVHAPAIIFVGLQRPGLLHGFGQLYLRGHQAQYDAVRTADKGLLILEDMSYVWDDLGSKIGEEVKEQVRDKSEMIAEFMLAQTVMLSSKSIKVSDVVTPDKLNKRRARKGLPPLVAQKVAKLVLPSVARRKASAGGEHASPKMHFRRGHLRRLPGSIIAVSPCIVGLAENGVITKEYRAIGRASREGNQDGGRMK